MLFNTLHNIDHEKYPQLPVLMNYTQKLFKWTWLAFPIPQN